MSSTPVWKVSIKIESGVSFSSSLRVFSASSYLVCSSNLISTSPFPSIPPLFLSLLLSSLPFPTFQFPSVLFERWFFFPLLFHLSRCLFFLFLLSSSSSSSSFFVFSPAYPHFEWYPWSNHQMRDSCKKNNKTGINKFITIEENVSNIFWKPFADRVCRRWSTSQNCVNRKESLANKKAFCIRKHSKLETFFYRCIFRKMAYASTTFLCLISS